MTTPTTKSPQGPISESTHTAHTDSLQYSLLRYSQAKRQLKFPVDRPELWPEWRSEAEEKLASLLRLPQMLSEPRSLIEADFGKPIEYPEHTREFVSFQTRPGLIAVGWLLKPKKIKTPSPALICLPGHGRGIDEIVGLDVTGSESHPDQTPSYQRNFALQAVGHGYVTFALEMIGFGHRRDHASRRGGPEQSSCMPAAGAALLLGETMAGWRVWDVIRCLDWFTKLEEVDSSRVGIMGISGGGTVASYVSALDQRVSCCVLSGSFSTFHDSIFSISHCIDNYVPDMLNWFEAADIAALIAPRPLFCESGLSDEIFPESGVRSAFEETQQTYQAMNAGESIGLELFQGGHVFDGKAAFAWLESLWKRA